MVPLVMVVTIMAGVLQVMVLGVGPCAGGRWEVLDVGVVV